MTDTTQKLVADFMVAGKQWDGVTTLSFPVPTVEETQVYRLRLKLMLEETFEGIEAVVTTAVYEESFKPLIEAMTAKLEHLQSHHFDVKPVDLFDSLLDQTYVNDGWANLMGFDLHAGFEEVHRSNLSKFDKDGQPIFRYDGKLLKGPDYSPPNLQKVYETTKFVYNG